MLSVNWEKLGGLLPVIVQSARSGEVLMLGYMSPEALEITRDEGYVCFFSRSRQKLWRKGEGSGNKLKVEAMQLDCDGDALLVSASPTGPTCHLGTSSCFGKSRAALLDELEAVISERRECSSQSSYVTKLCARGPSFVAQKVGEEAVEVAIASAQGDSQALLEESADLLFHMLVNLQVHGKRLDDVLAILEARREKVHAAT